MSMAIRLALQLLRENRRMGHVPKRRILRRVINGRELLPGPHGRAPEQLDLFVDDNLTVEERLRAYDARLRYLLVGHLFQLQGFEGGKGFADALLREGKKILT